MKLEKYVNDCVDAITNKVKEDKIINYINTLVSYPSEYKDLAMRVVFDVCSPSFKVWRHVPLGEMDSVTDEHIKTLYFTAFKKAFPEAWKVIQSYYNKN